MCNVVIRFTILDISIRSILLTMSLKFYTRLLNFFSFFSIIEKGILKSPTMIADLSISPFSSIFIL